MYSHFQLTASVEQEVIKALRAAMYKRYINSIIIIIIIIEILCLLAYCLQACSALFVGNNS